MTLANIDPCLRIRIHTKPNRFLINLLIESFWAYIARVNTNETQSLTNRIPTCVANKVVATYHWIMGTKTHIRRIYGI